MKKINPEMTTNEIYKKIFGKAGIYEPTAMPLDIAYELVKDEYKHIERSLRDWAWDVVGNDIDNYLSECK